MAAWIAPSAVNLIGQLPTRAGTRPYPLGDESLVSTIAVHYVGDPDPAGSVAGYGPVTPLVTARYQTTKQTGDLFPAIAYTWQIDPDGTLYQFHDPRVRTWHVGIANDRARGVLLPGFGRKGQPTHLQLVRLAWLRRDYQAYRGRLIFLLGHGDLMASVCPGDLAQEWLSKARGMAEMDKDQLREHLNVLWGYAAKAEQAGLDAAKAAVYLAAVASDCQETARAVRERVVAVKQEVGLE